MRFHRPPNQKWSSDAIAAALNIAGLSAKADPEGHDITVRAPAVEVPSIPIFWRKTRHVPEIVVVHSPHKFFYNGEIDHDLGKISVEAEIESITRVLEEFGCTVLPDDIQHERDLLLPYAKSPAQIHERFAEIERLQRVKENCVENQAFEEAGEAHSRQNAVRDEIDALLAQDNRARNE